MAGWTNESFLEMIEEDFPDTDWDNLPPIDSKPTYWQINGMQWQRLDFVLKGSEIKTKVGLSCGRFATKEEAEAKMESMKTDPAFCEERLYDDQTVPGHKLEGNSLVHKSYLGPVIFDTDKDYERLHIIELHDDELSTLHLYKDFLDDINEGKKVFPMYLP